MLVHFYPHKSILSCKKNYQIIMFKFIICESSAAANLLQKMDDHKRSAILHTAHNLEGLMFVCCLPSSSPKISNDGSAT